MSSRVAKTQAYIPFLTRRESVGTNYLATRETAPLFLAWREKPGRRPGLRPL